MIVIGDGQGARKRSGDFSGAGSRDGFLYRSGHRDQRVNLREFKKLQHIWAYPYGDDPDAPSAGPNEVTDEEPETGRVEGRNISNVKNVKRRTLTAGRWFKFKGVYDSERLENGVHVVCREAAGKLEDEDASLIIFNALDSEFWTLPQLGSDGGQGLSLEVNKL